MKDAAFILASLFVSTCLLAGDFHAVDENGVRIFSKVPPPGTHPRVILSPEDLPAWREHVVKTYRGQTFFSKRFESPRVIDVLADIGPEVSGEALVRAFPDTGPGANHDLLYATMDVIYHQDPQRSKTVCRAVANFARVVLARSEHEPAWGKWEENIGGIEGNSGIRTGLGELWCRGGADFALAYDFLYNDMTEAQRDVCRRALSTATKDLVCWGMNFPRGRGISNWYGYHGELGPMLLAIEGEEGFRADQWKAFRQMIRDWAEVHIYETGGSNEDGYTINTSLREGQFTLIAMARRGENHYTRPNIRNYFKWLVLSLVPGEKVGDTVGYSSSRAAPYESAPVLARWAMPGDPWVNYYLMRYKGKDYGLQNRWQYGSWSTLLCMNYESSEDLPLEMGGLGLPITHVFPLQGLFITRSDWTDQAAYLNVLARQDAWYDRHENVDRGRFVFAANGRRWAIDRPWATAQRSDDHSLVHIDGLAQVETRTSGARGKAPNAQLLKHANIDSAGNAVQDSRTDNAGAFSYAVLDLSNAYNWTWAHSWRSPGDDWEPETRRFDEIGWAWKRPGQPERLHGTDNETVPRYNFLGCNLWRKPYNPVEKAVRVACLVRGHHSYAVIADDIKKDGSLHDYQWFMPIPNDLEQKTQRGNDIVLGETAEALIDGAPAVGSRRLLVRFVSPGGIDLGIDRYQLGVDKRTQEPLFASRLVGSVRSVEPNFKVVLVPFLVGEPLPQTVFTKDTLRVSWNDQSDTIVFESLEGELCDLTMTQELSERAAPKHAVTVPQTARADGMPANRVVSSTSMESRSSPLAWFAFDEAEGNSLEDSVGKLVATYSRTTRAPGRVGNALEFDGRSDHVEMPPGMGNSRKGSFACWIKSPEPTDDMAMVLCASTHAKSAGNGGTNEVALFLSNRGNVCLGVANVKLHGPVLTDGQWHHVAATWDDEVTLYVDGSRLEQSPRTGPDFNWSGHVTLGKAGAPQRYYRGLLDEVRFYNRAITASEVAQLSE